MRRTAPSHAHSVSRKRRLDTTCYCSVDASLVAFEYSCGYLLFAYRFRAVFFFTLFFVRVTTQPQSKSRVPLRTNPPCGLVVGETFWFLSWKPFDFLFSAAAAAEAARVAGASNPRVSKTLSRDQTNRKRCVATDRQARGNKPA